MAERVVTLDLGVEWEPNAPEAVFLSDDSGRAFLALSPHPNDSDLRMVVIVWTGARAALMQPPNDEALSGHPLYDKGLAEVRWSGEVLDSAWIERLERQNRVHPHHDPARFSTLRHFILPLKEDTVEVVAREITVRRIDASTSSDALSRIIGE